MAGNLTAMIASIFSGGVTPDPYYEYTTLLLPGNGTNGAQNNTFLDGSTNNFTITRNGNTTQGTFSPFSQTGWGNYFNGSSQYLSTPDNAAFTLGSGDFTVEVWVYKTTTGTVRTISSQCGSSGANASTSYALQVNASEKVVGSINSGATNYAATSSGNCPLNAWTHIALARDGNTLRLYINGIQDGTASVTGVTVNDSSDILGIGSLGAYTSLYWSGYISNFRLVKGRCVYPSGTTFNPPTSPLTRTTGGTNPPQGTECSLLTCQSNRFLDSNGVNTPASSPLTITPNGSPTIVAFSPFNPTASWSAATYGGSGYFDGNADYLTAGVASNWTFLHNGSDWTCEFWVYHTGTNLYGVVSTTAFSAETGMSVFVNNTGSSGLVNGLQVYVTRGASGFQAVFNSTALLAINQWNYVAITFTSSTKTCSFTINGASAGSSSDTGFLYSASNPTNTLAVGRYQGSTPGGYLLGYISSLRISTNVRTGLTSVPTAPYTSDANTKLLLNFTNAGIYDATSKNDLETVDGAQISNAVTPKWGSTSIKFDGTGDYLQSPDSELVEFGSGDFTIETWVRFAALPSSGAYYTLVSKWDNSTQKSYLWYVYNASGTYQLYFTYTTNGSTNINPVATITPSINTWYHYAVSRSGANLRMFIDGTQVGSTYNIATDTIFGGTYQLQVGAATGANTLNGYMQDVRITKGYARYVTGTGANAGKMVFNGTNDLALPTAAFPTL